MFPEAVSVKPRVQVKDGNHNAFLDEGVSEDSFSTAAQIEARRAYFTDECVWQSLCDKVGQFELANMQDITSFLTGRFFHKIYLSNAPSLGLEGTTKAGMIRAITHCDVMFAACLESLRRGGLVYRVRSETQAFLGQDYDGFRLRQDLTDAAAAYETGWIHEVYQKM